MQYSIVSLKESKIDNNIFRFDADYFYIPSYSLYKKIRNNKPLRIKDGFDVTKLAGFEYTKFFTFQNTNTDSFYIVLTSKNIQNENLVLSDYLKINKQIADLYLKRSKLKKGDVVLSYTGEYRRALVLEESNFQLGPNICLIRPKNRKINPYYLSTFLNSKLGQLLLDREKTLSAQPTVAMSRIREIIIPNLTSEFQNLLENIIQRARNKKILSTSLYAEAENLILSELELKTWKPKHKISFVKNFSNTIKTERIDAEYFQPKYDEILEKIKTYTGGFTELWEIVKINDKNFNPEDEKFYQYIELANILGNGEIGGFTEALGDELPSRAKRKVKIGDVIVSSIEGSLESAALINKELENALCSTGFFVISSKEINSETLFCFLKTIAGQLQLKKGCSGTILTAINKSEFSKILIPKIKLEIQQEIKRKINEMYKVKKESKDLLEKAKKAVEIAIEENEKIALNFLNS